MLRDRILAAVLGLPMLFVVLWLNWYLRTKGVPGDLPLLFIVLVIAGAGGWEASQAVRHRLPAINPWNGLYAAVLLPFLVHAIRMTLTHPAGVRVPHEGVGLLIDSVGATAAVMLLFLGIWSDVEQHGWAGVKANAISLVAGLYLGATMSALLLLGETPFQEYIVFFVFVGVFALDTFAYFGGKRLQGPRLAPRISPAKTWSGAITGLLAAVVIALAFKVAAPYVHPEAGWNLGAHLQWRELLLLGIGVGVFGQIGDLVESAFKRWSGVKDSGSILPGHGGFLDRFDSLLLAAPVVYLLLTTFKQWPR